LTTGTVIEFDDDVGIGVVRDDGAPHAEHFFHCTEIADGTRTIAVGAKVAYDVGPGHRGRWEARRLTRR
jgi:cold shock CspA family protein